MLRFTNTERFGVRWYRTLPKDWKLAFEFIWAKCDRAGVWEIEPDLIQFHVQVNFNAASFLKACNTGTDLLPNETADEHVVLLPDSKHLWLVYFCVTCYPKGLKPKTQNAHLDVVASLRRWGLYERVVKQYRAMNLKPEDSPELTGITAEVDAGCEKSFEEFWELYPRKEAKPYALKKWRQAVGPQFAKLLPLILENVQARIDSGQWSDPQFIPHPSTYLNQSRWLDAVVIHGQPKKALTDDDHRGGFRKRA